MNVDYLDNTIELLDGRICTIEIENKAYFFRFVNALYHIMNGEGEEGIQFYDENLKEMNCNGKIQVISNYFQFDFNTKRIQSALIKYVNENMSDDEKTRISGCYSNFIKEYKKVLSKLDIAVDLEVDENVDSLAKLLKVAIPTKEELIDNISLMIDLEKELRINKILFFVNLKQYLSREEIIELYKYALYNSVSILLIDSIHYDIINDYESKLMIDDNLEEVCYNVKE